MSDGNDDRSPSSAADGAPWEARYAQAHADRLWSGRPHRALVESIEGIEPGCALDVGCGEGADARWLAARGWDVDGLDLSATAVARARELANATGAERLRFHVGDLLAWAADRASSYDLVSAAFLHTPAGGDRGQLLRRAADLVRPGGRLLVVSHATPPPWAHQHGPSHSPVTPESDRQLLAIGGEWQTEAARRLERSASGPDGSTATLEDSILLLRRDPSSTQPGDKR